MSGLFRSPTPSAEPLRDLGAYDLGGTIFILERGLHSLQATVYTDDDVKLYATPFPVGADDSLGLQWCLDLVVSKGAEGQLITLRQGSIEPMQVWCSALAAKTIQQMTWARCDEEDQGEDD